MTPRRRGNSIVFGPDSPSEEEDGHTFEYQNPRQGRAAAVGPLSSTSAGARKATRMTAAASPAAAAATVPAATAVAAAAAGLIAVAAASPRREGEEK